MKIALLLLFYFGVPILMQWASKHFTWIDKVGVVTLCYISGILLGNAPGVTIPEVLGTPFMGPIVALSIPLLLFSSDIKIWRKLGPVLTLAFLGCVISVCIAATIGTLIFKEMIAEAWQFAAMLIGVFTGMTVNMFAVGMSLNVNHGAMMVLNGAEMLFGGLYLLFLLTVAKPLFSRILKSKNHHTNTVTVTLDEKFYWKSSPIGLLLSAGILGLAFGLSVLINRDKDEYHETTIIMLTVTTLGILVSTIPRIRNLKGSFGTGSYLMYVFCVAVGSHADVSKVFSAAPALLVFVFAVLTIAVVLHCLFCKLLGIDTDAFLISSTAGIQGPAFIGPVSKAIGNQGLIPVGIALALLGLTLGNYIGVGMSFLLRLL